jgi:hypothetical protein
MLPRARDAESVLARASPRDVLGRAAAFLGCAFVLWACDTILGIEDHGLAEGGASPPLDGSHEAGTDAKADSGDREKEAEADSGDDSELSQCDEGLNSTDPAVECEQGPDNGWFASPYSPKGDLTVERLEVHYGMGSVALLTSAGGLPGDVLFMGAVTAIGTTGWAGADVSPPLSIRAGVDYFLAFEGGCSFGQGPAAIEFSATTLAGPWSADGDDVWTARVLGKCGQ